jgi:hypothetical protein
MSRVGYAAWATEAPDTVAASPFASLLPTRPSNTRDQLRGAHDLPWFTMTAGHDGPRPTPRQLHRVVRQPISHAGALALPCRAVCNAAT